jgi:preprotein translocase subunit Sec61beta
MTMAKKEKSMLPSSQAGLVRYYDVEEGIKVKPHVVVWLGVMLIVFVLVLKFLI